MFELELFDAVAGKWVMLCNAPTVRVTTEEGQVFVVTESGHKGPPGGLQIRTPNASIGMAPVASNVMIMREIR